MGDPSGGERTDAGARVQESEDAATAFEHGGHQASHRGGSHELTHLDLAIGVKPAGGVQAQEVDPLDEIAGSRFQRERFRPQLRLSEGAHRERHSIGVAFWGRSARAWNLNSRGSCAPRTSPTRSERSGRPEQRSRVVAAG